MNSYLQPWLISILEKTNVNSVFEKADEAVSLCIAQAKGKISKRDLFKITGNDTPTRHHIILSELSNITGLFGLRDNISVKFDHNLSVIYGTNGSGKTSIVKLLKYSSGRDVELKGNFLKEKGQEKKFTISYFDNGIQHWFSYPDSEKLMNSSIDVFDDEEGNRFIENKKQIAVEPEELVILKRLSDFVDVVRDRIQKQKDELDCSFPNYADTGELDSSQYEAYISLMKSENSFRIRQEMTAVSWTEEDEVELSTVITSLKEENYQKHIQDTKDGINSLKRVERLLSDILCAFSDDNLTQLSNDKKDAQIKQNALQEYVNNVFSKSEIQGVGSETWKAMWEAAERYSEIVYPGHSFPNTDETAVCLLCHQPIVGKAKQLFTSFDQFVKGEIDTQANLAKRKYLENPVLNVQIETELICQIISSSSAYESIDIISLHNELVNLCLWIDHQKSIENDYTQPVTFVLSESLSLVQGIITQHNEMLQQLITDSARISLEATRKKLSTRKWINNNKDRIELYCHNLEMRAVLEEARKTTNTSSITRKANEISKEYLDEHYVRIFNETLAKLHANHLNVSLVSTAAVKGRGAYRIVLNDVNNGEIPIANSLSSGERRIVAIAAFIADSINNDNTIPFVFDDPVSSLDNEFEREVAKALKMLSETRQVIVFSHRLSFVSLFSDSNITQLIGRKGLGCGIQEEKPVLLLKSISKVIGSINNLKQDVDSSARKVDRGEISVSDCERILQGFCSLLRNLAEQSIEVGLINCIVTRFSKDVTSSKVQWLGQIEPEECVLIDKLMTKYSYYDHSQSTESPPPVISFQELSDDCESLRIILTSLKNRQDSYRKQEI